MFISKTVQYATIFFRSIWTIIFRPESSIPINVIKNKNKLNPLNKILNLYKPNKAVFTKIPLKKIEKPVLASTCVFVNQKWNGHIGIFIPKPKNNNK